MKFFKEKSTRPFAIAISICLLLLIAFSIWFICKGDPKDVSAPKRNYYELVTLAVAVDDSNDVVVCEDSNGNLWEFQGVQNWKLGDSIHLLMDDMNTASIYDDTICGSSSNNWILIQR